MRILMSLAFLATISAPAFGDDVPYADPASSRLGSSSETYYASLSDIMNLTQLRHIKLWYAGSTGNWALTSFEIKQIKDTFSKAAMFYNKIPTHYVMSIKDPLDIMQRASEQKDTIGFMRGFEALTTACNGCHQAAGVGFIVIQTPTSSPFGNQKF